MQHQQLKPGRKARQAVDGALGQSRPDLDVAQEHSLDGVLEADLPTEFAQLADVVQNDAGQKQVAVEQRVVRGDAVGQGEQADDMLEQAPQPGVVKLLGGRSLAVGGGERRVVEQRGDEQLQVRVGEARDKAEKLAPEVGHVVGGRGQQIGFVRLAGLSQAQLIDLHLQPVVEARGRTAGLDDVAPLELLGDARVGGLPDAAFELAGLVAQNEVQVGLVGFGGALLLEQHEEEAVEELALVKVGQIGDVNVFHSGMRRKQRMNRVKNTNLLKWRKGYTCPHGSLPTSTTATICVAASR